MEITVRLLGAFQKLLRWILWPIFFLNSLRPTPRLPQIKSDLLKQSVTVLARKIRNGEITSRQLVDACIERIKAVNPMINAVVEDRFKEAQEEANRVDDYIAANKDNLARIEIEKPLLGVPCSVKESLGLKGLSLSVGCLPRKGIIASDDGDAVKELKKAGAIPLCVTNTPEVCLCWESINFVTGCTRNPYNLHRTAGGSSGGEGALIGSGGSLFGIASDLAGSIRVPAMFNGVYGHKPSSGYVSLVGHFPEPKEQELKNLLTIGPMTRYAEDLPLILKVIGGEKVKDLNLDEQVDLKKLNVFYAEDAGYSLAAVQVTDEIKSLVRNAVLYLKNTYGCFTGKGPFQELEDSVEISGTVFLGLNDVPDLLSFSQKKNKNEMTLYKEALKSLFGMSEFTYLALVFLVMRDLKLFIPKSRFDVYYKMNEKLKIKFVDTLKDNGVFLYPTYPIPAFHHHEVYTVTSGVMYAMIFNTLGLPSTHVPLGLGKDGLPIGIQVVAGPNQDRLCLAVAKALEEKFGGWVPPPS